VKRFEKALELKVKGIEEHLWFFLSLLTNVETQVRKLHQLTRIRNDQTKRIVK
jgi:hypothetical protein